MRLAGARMQAPNSMFQKSAWVELGLVADGNRLQLCCPQRPPADDGLPSARGWAGTVAVGQELPFAGDGYRVG